MSQFKSARARWRAAGVTVLALTAALGLACKAEEGDLTFTLQFEDARGLQEGHPVVFRGVEIGEVTGVELGDEAVLVEVVIFEEHREAVYREASYVIESPGGLGGFSGKRQITVRDRGSERTAIRQGDSVEGDDSPLQVAMDRLREGWERTGEMWQRLQERAEEFADSPRGQELREKLEKFSEEAQRRGRERWEQFREDELPRLKEQAERLRDELEKEGKLDQAQELWQRFQDWLRTVDEGPAPGEEDSPPAGDQPPPAEDEAPPAQNTAG